MIPLLRSCLASVRTICNFVLLLTAAVLAASAASLPDQCIYALNRSVAGALTVDGTVNLNLNSCGVVVNSNDPAAFIASGTGTFTARYIDVVGGYSTSGQITFSVPPQTGAPYRQDPLRFLTPPAAKKCDFTNVNIASGSTTLSPGTYCNGISISGNANVTVAPGTYVLMGGGLHASGSSKLTGQGTIVLTQGLGFSYGPLTVADSAQLDLRALKNGDYPGVLFYQDATAGSALAPSVINGSRNSRLEGVLYFPTSALTWSGSAPGTQGEYLAIVADTVHLTGSATIASNYGPLQRWLELASAALGLQGGSAVQSSQPSARVAVAIDSNTTFTLKGNTHPLIASSTDIGAADASPVFPRIVMHLSMTPTQQADLKQLLAAQQDQSSPWYHKWLTPEQFAQRFGASESDVSQITAWLQSIGFTDVAVARGRTFITMSGTAAQVQYAFQTPVRRYSFNGEIHHAIAADPVLPRALQGVVAGIRGLDDFHPKPHARRVAQPRFTSSITGNHFIAPEDFQIIYGVQSLIQSGINGSGQSIAIAGQTDINNSDVEAFQTASGLPVKDPQVVLDGNDPGIQSQSGDLSEADLDIEWAGAVAPGATIIYVNSTDVFTSLTYAIDNNLASVLSISYGACEAQIGANTINSLNTTFQQANAQGMTVVAPGGDDGAADCDSGSSVRSATHGLTVDFPCSSPYVTCAGGSEFSEGTGTYWAATSDANNGSALSYIPETAWNDTNAQGLSAGGGGASSFISKPTWQQGTGVPNDNLRDVPDVVLSASPNHDPYLICSGGSCVNGFRDANQNLDVVGGTSCSTPTFAGIVALVDQQASGRQGNINPTLYSLASISTDAFHDITTGNNQVPCTVNTPNCTTGTLGYVAGTGYDQVTGLGSVNAYALATEWKSGFAVSITPASLNIARGTSGTASVQVTAVSGFSGTVALSCSVASSLTNTTCSIPSTVNGSGSVTLTIANSSTSARIPWLPSIGSWRLTGMALLAASAVLLFGRRRVRVAGFGLVALSLMLAACGGGNSNTSVTSQVTPTPLIGNVTVTATSGMVSHTATLAVTVQ